MLTILNHGIRANEPADFTHGDSRANEERQKGSSFVLLPDLSSIPENLLPKLATTMCDIWSRAIVAATSVKFDKVSYYIALG